MRKQILTAVTVGSLLFAACGDTKTTDDNSSQTTTGNTAQTATNSSEDKSETANLFLNREVLKNAEEQLKNMDQFKNKDIRVFQKINFYEDGRILLSIQDPEKPENIDEYLFRNGEWQEPQPLQLSGDGDMSANTFALSILKFESVADIYQELQNQIKEIEGGKINGHIFYNLNVMKQEGQWIASVDGIRSNYSAYFNANGSLKDFKKN